MSTPTNSDARGRTGTGDTILESTPSILSVHRAFVVQFREPPGPVWNGRVEHIASGRSATFTSPAELLAFLDSVPPVDASATDQIHPADSRGAVAGTLHNP
jgi:hypothetical protein